MRLTLILIILCFGFYSQAQQGRNFSMWYHNNFQHNAAAVGLNDHDIKAGVNFRYQYFTVTNKPFQTISASAEGKLLQAKRSKSHLGLGVSFINDRSGDGKYSVNDIMIPIAYHIYFDDRNSLSVGASPGIYQTSLKGDEFTWESQWNGFEFNRGLDPDVAGGMRFNTLKFDIGAGLMYKYEASATRKYYAGFSARHILRPDVSFGAAPDKLYMRYIGQFGMKHRFNLSDFGISPNVIATFQGPNRNIVLGSNFDFYLQDPSLRTVFITPTHFSTGIYYRLMEGIIINFQYYFQGMNFALSYDTNINSMIPASKSVGALEFCFTYDIIIDKKSKFIY